MTLVSEIIQDAYRESNLLAISASPTSTQTTEAERLLNRIFYAVFGDEMGDPLRPIPIGRNNITTPQGYPWYENVPYEEWFVPNNTRLVLNVSSAQTLYLHPEPNDGSRLSVQDLSGNLATNNVTLVGNGRTIAGATTAVLSTNSLNREWFYRADLGDWKQISDLAAADTWPFPEKFDDLFITGLAMRLNPRYGVEADPQTVEAYRKGLRQFRARYHQKTEVSPEFGVVQTPLSKRSRRVGGDLGNSMFDAGREFP